MKSDSSKVLGKEGRQDESWEEKKGRGRKRWTMCPRKMHTSLGNRRKIYANKFISSRNGKEPKEYEKKESKLKTELIPLRNKSMICNKD